MVRIHYVTGGCQFADILLRNSTFTPLPGCDPAVLASSAAFADVAPKACGEQYTDAGGYTRGVCSSSTIGACAPQPVVGTALAGLSCSCPPPEFPNPDLADDELAPYAPSGGCINPRKMDRIQVSQP